MKFLYNSHFREELVITAVVVGVLFSGSFFLSARLLVKDSPQKTPDLQTNQVLGTNEQLSNEDLSELLDALDNQSQKTAKPTPGSRAVSPITPLAQNLLLPTQASSSSSPSTLIPQYANTVIEQPYGNGGEYDNADYRLSIINPRLVVSASRVFKVDVVLANKRIVDGLKNRLSATIIKEGEVIAESAPFSLSESATAFPGEQISFTATLSLIAGTDVARLKYLPFVDGVIDIAHDL